MLLRLSQVALDPLAPEHQNRCCGISISRAQTGESPDSKMSGTPDTFRDLMRRIQGGDEEAVRQLLDQYGAHVFRAVRRSLSRAIRSKYDSQDFVQSVWKSFFTRREELKGFDTPDQLIAFLTRVAGNKVIDQGRHHLRTEKADVTRERSITDRDCVRTPAHDPSPSEVAVANELWGRIIAGQPEHYRRILDLRAAGYTYQQIADELKINERTVRRVLNKLELDLPH